MNQALNRVPTDAAGLTFYPFCTSALSTSVLQNGSISSDATTKIGNIIDLQTLSGHESLSLLVGARALITNSSDSVTVIGHFETDTSSAFGGSTTLGSTFTLTLYPSSGTSTEEGVLVATVDLNNSKCYRYIRGRFAPDPSSADGDYIVVAPVYMLGGKDQSPTSHNIMTDGTTAEVAS